jgi:rare lipoprotein A
VIEAKTFGFPILIATALLAFSSRCPIYSAELAKAIPHVSPVAAEPRHTEIGNASWYGAHLQGRRTASGEPYDPQSLTAAHPTLPLHSTVRVTNLNNGRSVEVRINDRGPYTGRRVIDLSLKAAETIGLMRRGVARVKVEALPHARPVAYYPPVVFYPLED